MTTPLLNDLTHFLLRDLATLRDELEAYPDDASVWALPPGAPNSAGTLCLHLTGNLRHYVGALLGATGYQRDRAAEFGVRDLSRTQLLEHVADAERAVADVLPGLDPATLTSPFPETLRNTRLSVQEALLQVAVHLGYHLGQIDYHRRLLTGDPRSVDALSPASIRPSAEEPIR